MNIGPLPDPRAAVLNEIERKIAEYFGAGGKAEPAAAFKPEPLPTRSNKIDPDTVLKRRRPSPSHAERIALRRITEAL
ncbi:hypothetical protein ACQKP5_00950 [Pseudomonas vancouverensis]|uniref:hypothetical protein n=1 Tax=Pseudomonas vancouverensis TaxID=95300 RepID=UPI003D044CB3